MLESDVKQLYNDWLTKDFGSMKKIEVWPVVSLVPGPLIVLHMHSHFSYLTEGGGGAWGEG